MIQEVTTGMREKGIKHKEWIDREELKRKIKCKHRSYENINTLYKK